MGPWNEEVQLKRAENIQKILANPNLSPDARAMWERHLRGLSRSEAQYNARVVQLFTEMRNRYTEKWI